MHLHLIRRTGKRLISNDGMGSLGMGIDSLLQLKKKIKYLHFRVYLIGDVSSRLQYLRNITVYRNACRDHGQSHNNRPLRPDIHPQRM